MKNKNVVSVWGSSCCMLADAYHCGIWCLVFCSGGYSFSSTSVHINIYSAYSLSVCVGLCVLCVCKFMIEQWNYTKLISAPACAIVCQCVTHVCTFDMIWASSG